MDKIKTYKKFVNDPEWKDMEELISQSLAVNIDVRSIDITKDQAVIVGEVVARREMAVAVQNLFKTFEQIKQHDPEKKIEQKKPLK